MKVTAHPTSTDQNRAVTLVLSLDEALALENLLGNLSGGVARCTPWYDRIADELEAKILPGTISQAIEEAGLPRLPSPYRTDLDTDGVLRRWADEHIK